jgi:multiple sugar transport system substrate-binding protein
MKRRDLVSTCAFSVFGASLPLASTLAEDRYTKYKGSTVSMSIPKHPHYDAMIKLLPEFTRQTGIKVEFEQLSFPQMKSKQLLEMTKPQGPFDLISYVVMWKGEYVKKELIQELEPFFKNPKLADPDYGFKDLAPNYVENLGLVGGRKGYLAGAGANLYGIPYGAETSVLAYRRDIFEKYGFKVPTNYVELANLLPAIKNKTGIGALTSRGKIGHQCVHAWLLHLNPLGGKVFDDQWNPIFNNEQGVEALKFLKLIAETGPSDIPNFGQDEMLLSFLQGNSCMYLDSTLIFGQVKNSSISKVNGLIGYTTHPYGKKYSSQSGGLGLAIPKNAKNADAAFLLLQWLTSKKQDMAIAKLGGQPSRMSTLGHSELLHQFPEYITLIYQMASADPDWRPIIPEWDEINTQLLGVAVHEALTGQKSPKEALSAMTPKVKSLMQKAGYIK